MNEYFAQLVAIAAMVIAVSAIAAMSWTMRDSARQLRELLQSERDRNRELSDVIIDMKVAGGVAQRLRPLPDGMKLEQPRRSDIDQAIDENKYANSIPGLRGHLADWAAKELRRGDGSERDRLRVLDRLRTWSNVSDDDDDDEDDDEGVIAIGGDFADELEDELEEAADDEARR